MGFFEGLDAEKYDRQYSDKVLIKRIVAYLAIFRKRLLVVSLMIAVIALLGAALPVVVSKGVDALKINASPRALYFVPLGVLLISVGIWLLNWWYRVWIIKIIADVSVRLATEGFEFATRHDLSFHDNYSSGRIVSRITTDTRDFSQLVMLVAENLAMVIESLILGIVLFSIEWKLSLVLLAMIPLVFLMAISFRALARKVTQTGMRAMANVNSTIKETISGISIAKNFRQEGAIYHEFDTANTLSYKVNVRRGMVLTAVFPALNIIGGIATTLLVYWGGLSVTTGLVTAGAWYLFIISLDRFMYPVMQLSSFWTQVQTGLSAAERIFALIDAEPAVRQTRQDIYPVLKGRIDFDHVHFQYKEQEPVLEDFTFHIQEGENIALVGHTGSGKSSIARLIARFYEFQSGTISIDGKDIRTLDLKEYRRKLGIVTQMPFLFSTSVSENIRYANPEISDGEILALGRKIGDGEWLETLPDGLSTQVGERGARLSMGQKQLVALMRVLVRRPSIFILDEATASIDPFTEWQIQQALNLILAQTSSILIAHRLSTVRSADRIIVLDKGKIIEEGSHVHLLENKGYYANLYNTYFRHQSLAYVEQSRQIVKPGLKLSVTPPG